jgi:hypothetical protein
MSQARHVAACPSSLRRLKEIAGDVLGAVRAIFVKENPE